MSTLSTRAEALRDRVLDALADMSPRDRSLLAGLLIAFPLVIVLGGAWWMNSTLSELEGRVTSYNDTLHLIRVMAEDHAEATDRVAEAEAKLKGHDATDLSAYLEQAAGKVGISDKLASVRERSAASSAFVEEKLYAVKLSKLSLEEMATFLFEVETAGYPLQIRSLKVKTRTKRGEKELSVDLDVTAYRVIEGPEEEAG